MLGERFGSFKAVAKLGAGGMGEVFLAEHQRIERRAAIKVLMPERTRDADAVRRFFIEARATSLIHHPGIVEIYDCDVHRNGRAYIVMEHLEGETLGKRLDRMGSLSWTAACLITRRIADAIGAAHDKGIAHRDLKPENVFLLSDADRPGPREVKVLDFGLAKLRDLNLVGGLGTQQGSLLGSPAYMSPEQAAGGPIDHRCDVYSLGCLLFEMIAGRPPFTGKRLRRLLDAHRFSPPPALSELAAEVPPWLDDLVARMLAKDPGGRPQSMAAVVAVLERAEDAACGEEPARAARDGASAAPTQLRT